MRVVVPYVAGRLHPRVLPALERQGCVARLTRLDAGNPHAYRSFLEHLFVVTLRDEDVAIVEHDVESRTGFLDSYDVCDEPWCFHAYDFTVPYDEAGIVGFAPFGHTRLRRSMHRLMRGLPAYPEWATLGDHNGLDTAFGHYLCERGQGPHRHAGNAVHHHDYAAHPAGDVTRAAP